MEWLCFAYNQDNDGFEHSILFWLCTLNILWKSYLVIYRLYPISTCQKHMHRTRHMHLNLLIWYIKAKEEPVSNHEHWTRQWYCAADEISNSPLSRLSPCFFLIIPLCLTQHPLPYKTIPLYSFPHPTPRVRDWTVSWLTPHVSASLLSFSLFWGSGNLNPESLWWTSCGISLTIKFLCPYPIKPTSLNPFIWECG